MPYRSPIAIMVSNSSARPKKANISILTRNGLPMPRTWQSSETSTNGTEISSMLWRYPFILNQNEFGTWKCQFALKQPIKEFSKVKCQVTLPDGHKHDRIPAWINYAVQDPVSKGFDGAYTTQANFKFNHPKPKWSSNETALKVYECHIGMSGVSP